MERNKFRFWTASQLLEVRTDRKTNAVFFGIYKRDEEGKLIPDEKVIVAPTYAELLAMIRACEAWIGGRSIDAFLNISSKFSQMPDRDDGLYFVHDNKIFGLALLKKKIKDKETGDVRQIPDKLGFVVSVKEENGKRKNYVFPLTNLELLKLTEIIKNEVLPVALNRERVTEDVENRNEAKVKAEAEMEEEPWVDENETVEKETKQSAGYSRGKSSKKMRRNPW
jgi:hypothetical protein